MKLDYKQRLQLNGFLEVALDEDELAEMVSDIIVERDRLRERVEALETALRYMLETGLLSKDWPKVVAAARKLL